MHLIFQKKYVLTIIIICLGAFVAFLLTEIFNPSNVNLSSMPNKVGVCKYEIIVQKSLYNEDDPSSGTVLKYTFGGLQYAFEEQESEINSAKVGDVVKICAMDIQDPKDCPVGDTRGNDFITTDLRTHQQWDLLNSSRGCGGA